MSMLNGIQVKKTGIIFNSIQRGVTAADMQTIHGFFAPADELFFIATFPEKGIRFKEG